MIFLEDDDVAAVKDGCLTIHRLSRSMDGTTTREVVTLRLELQQIMKGDSVGNFQDFVLSPLALA